MGHDHLNCLTIPLMIGTPSTTGSSYAPPPQATDMEVTQDGSNDVVQWIGHGGEDGFSVFRGVAPDFAYQYLGTTAAGVVTSTVPWVTNGTVMYTVTSWNCAGSRPFQTAYVRLGKVEDVGVTQEDGPGTSNLTVTWGAVHLAGDYGGYELQFSTDNATWYTVYTGTALIYIHSTVLGTDDHAFYRVRAGTIWSDTFDYTLL